MVCVNLIQWGKDYVGFEVSGHAEAGNPGEDVVCASISSACYLVANTITDVMHLPGAAAQAEAGYMKVTVPPPQAPRAQELFQGLALHLGELMKQYPNHLKVLKRNTEV